MGNICCNPEWLEDLQKWDATTRATVSNVDKRLDAILKSVTSSTTNQTALTALEGADLKLASVLPEPTGAAKTLPLLLDRNCLLQALTINETYDRTKNGLVDVWYATMQKIANAKTYLTALKSIETSLASSKTEAATTEKRIVALDDAGVAKLALDTAGWSTQKANITTDATAAAYTNPRTPNAKQALSFMKLTQPAALVTYVEATIAEYAQYRIALAA